MIRGGPEWKHEYRYTREFAGHAYGATGVSGYIQSGSDGRRLVEAPSWMGKETETGVVGGTL